MKPFRYARPDAVAEAIRSGAQEPGARFLAGGTNLIDLMKLGVERPDLVVDVGGLGLDEIAVDPDGRLRIGANVRNTDLAVHPAVRRALPMLSQALLSRASGQLRNQATAAGQPLRAGHPGRRVDGHRVVGLGGDPGR